jgi:formate hydrogenlyase subunit 6/NADH:ubiquinone oxidoreductase subunit I
VLSKFRVWSQAIWSYMGHCVSSVLCVILCPWACLTRIQHDKNKNAKIEYLTQSSREFTRFNLWGRVVAK